MKLAVVRDTPRCAFTLVADGQRVGEFPTEQAAWEFAEDAFGVAQSENDTKYLNEK
jgi:hypothetical protein